ncbi:MAG: tetratricopeptide repeat protein [Planctomycetota bacterium]|nr:tetratricopeptide repeat protein [Planctomycetota bacterium]
MNSHRQTRQRKPRTAVGFIPPSGRGRWWRWIWLICGALGVAIGLVYLLSGFRLAPERVRLRKTIGELTAQVAPDSALLLRELGDAVDRLLQQFPEDGESLQVMATLYRGLGRTADAVHCWERCLELAPELGPSAHAQLGAVAYEEGRLDAAAEHYRAAMQQEPAATTHPVRLAEVLIDQGQFSEAAALLESVLRTRPRLMAASVLLGQAYLRLQQYDKARQHLEMGVELGPDYPTAYFVLAAACARLGDQEKSREYQEKFQELQRQQVQQHRQALKANSDTGRLRETIAQTYAAAGEVYIRYGDYETAEKQLRRAGEIDPQAIPPRVVLAWLYEQQSRTDQALGLLAEIHQLAPQNLGTQMSLGAAYARLRRCEEAEQAYRRAIALTPKDAGGYAALAHFFLQTGLQPEQAVRLAQRAVELEPAADQYFLLSQARKAKGDHAGAAQAIEQALAREPGNSNYQEFAHRLRLLAPKRQDAK